MNKKISSELTRLALNFWPCIRGAGGRIIYLAPDYTHLTVKLSLSWRTRNVVGTIFGGSMYASTDPFFMLMFMKILGKDYVVWDKGCTIRFKRPAKKTIFADFRVTPEMLSEVKEKVAVLGETTFTWTIQYKDKDGVVYSEFDKVIYFATKEVYKEKLKRRESKL